MENLEETTRKAWKEITDPAALYKGLLLLARMNDVNTQIINNLETIVENQKEIIKGLKSSKLCDVKHPKGKTKCQRRVGHVGPHNGGTKSWNEG